MTLKRPCAVKENLDTSPEAGRQFEKEAIVLAQLSHPNLPRVQDHFTIPNQGQYLVMDFIEGEDLQTIVQQGGRVDPETALDWIGQIAGALGYLHDQNPPIIHRDIKPANIRVTSQGRAFLVDFGLVKVYDPHLRTTIGARAVTPGYSPPEQYGQGNTDVRTDVYALGATLYTLLTGLEPQESVQRVVDDHLIPLQAANTRVQEAMSQAVGKAMDLRPSGRYTSVGDFEKALKASKTQPDEVAATVQVVPPVEVPIPERTFETTHIPEARVAPTKKQWWQQPWLYLGLIALFALCIFVALSVFQFQLNSSEPTSVVETLVVSATADNQATEAVQTSAAGTEQAKATNAVMTSDALTEAVPSETPTPEPPTETPTQEQPPTETLTLTPTDTLTPMATNTSAPAPSYFVIDNWCTTHQGCATVDVRNQTGLNSSWHIWNTEFNVDTTFTIYPGISTIETRPGKYNFYITYCGGAEVADFAWQLNNNWYYKLSPCD
jgi:serine/threonine protein kinase